MLWRHVSAVETWDMLYGHGTCLLVGEEYVFLLERNICRLVGEEYMSSCWTRIDVFLLEKNIWCLLVGEEYMDMEDVFLLEKNRWIWKMYSCWIRVYGYGRCFLVG